MKQDKLREICTEVADSIAPGLLKQGISVVVMITDEDGWTYSVRGNLRYLKMTAAKVNEDIQNTSDKDYATLVIPEA